MKRSVTEDYQDKLGSIFVLNLRYKVDTKFHSSGVYLVNYQYTILDLRSQKVVLSGTNFNPSCHCKTAEEWPEYLGWRGVGELLKEVCGMPVGDSHADLLCREEDEIDWLCGEDSEELREIGEGILKSCEGLMYQI